MNMHALRSLAIVATLAAVVAGCGHEPAPAPAADGAPAASVETPAEHARKHLDPLYRCPMHPDVTSDKPGECPICGMDLVLVEPTGPDAAASDDAGTVVQVPGTVVQNLGIRTATAETGALGREVEVPGTVQFDERGQVQVRVRTEGHVERLHVRAAGERVRRDQLLLEMHAPMLAAAAGEFAAARRLGDAVLLEAAAARLQAMGLAASDLERLRAGESVPPRVAVRAPADGYVTELMIREGALVEHDMTVMTIAATDRVWVVAEVPEALADAVRAGTTATLLFTALPGESFNARVREVLPELNPMTRTLRARLELPNADGRLKAGMLARVRLDAPAGAQAVLVPLEAVIRTGKAERVVVALGGGRFVVREVIAGHDDGERVAVLSGLEAGEQVVVSGQFMLDSEAQVRTGLGRLGAGHEGHAGDEP